MRNFTSALSKIIYLYVLIALASCSRDEQLPETYGSLQIKVDLNNTHPHGRITDQAAPSALFISVSGPKDLALERIELVEFGDEYISNPIAFPIGSYQLTDFLVVDENNETTFATPKVGSEFANLVTDPLPIEFVIEKDNISRLSPQVLSTDQETPDDFGYQTFSFDVIETFLVSTFGITDDGFEFIKPNICLLSGTDTIYRDTIENANTIVPFPSSGSDYKLTIYMHGYERYDYEFAIDSLRQYKDSPLVIALNRAFTMSTYSKIIGLSTSVPSNFTVKNGYETIRYENSTFVQELFKETPEFSDNFISITGDLSNVVHFFDGYDITTSINAVQLDNLQKATFWLYLGNKLDLSSNHLLESLLIGAVDNDLDIILPENNRLKRLEIWHVDISCHASFTFNIMNADSIELLYIFDCPNLKIFDLGEFISLIKIFMEDNEFSQGDIEFILSKLYNSLLKKPRYNGTISLDDPISSTTALHYKQLIEDKFRWTVN